MQFSPLPDWVIRETSEMFQHRFSFSLFCGRPLWAVLAYAGMSTPLREVGMKSHKTDESTLNNFSGGRRKRGSYLSLHAKMIQWSVHSNNFSMSNFQDNFQLRHYYYMQFSRWFSNETPTYETCLCNQNCDSQLTEHEDVLCATKTKCKMCPFWPSSVPPTTSKALNPRGIPNPKQFNCQMYNFMYVIHYTK